MSLVFDKPDELGSKDRVVVEWVSRSIFDTNQPIVIFFSINRKINISHIFYEYVNFFVCVYVTYTCFAAPSAT